MEYPRELVHAYGAKAGILMYVAKELPEIPQMPMVVSEIGESPRDFLGRADQTGIKWPRLFRSSAVVELLGYEGDFPTRFVDYFIGGDHPYLVEDGDYIAFSNVEEVNNKLEEIVTTIATSPQKNYPEDPNIPPEINVISQEEASSKYRGTLIQHPHDPELYVATVLLRADDVLKTTRTFTEADGFRRFGTDSRNLLTFTDEMRDELKTVIGWHNRIARLPEMDSGWTYQLEFGLNPMRLFQVRPFMEKRVASFKLTDGKRATDDPLVFGITPHEGTNFSMCSHRDRVYQDSILPKLLVVRLKELSGYSEEGNWQAYMLNEGGGLLEHEDVKAIRQSHLAIVYPSHYPGIWGSGREINVVSDGRHTKVTYLDDSDQKFAR